MRQIAILFAMRRESAPFLRRFGSNNPHVLVMETGVGPFAARKAAEYAINAGANRVIAAGFAGALSSAHRVGDVIIASEIVDTEGNRWPIVVPDSLQSIVSTRLASVRAIAATSVEKAALYERFHAGIVDMESATIAAVCHHHRIPMMAVRAVSDDASTDLSPRIVSLFSTGRVHMFRLIRAVAGQPSVIGELMRLARDTRLAARNLADVLQTVIQADFG